MNDLAVMLRYFLALEDRRMVVKSLEFTQPGGFPIGSRNLAIDLPVSMKHIFPKHFIHSHSAPFFTSSGDFESRVER